MTVKTLKCNILFTIGNTENLMTGFEGTTLSMNTLPVAFYNGLWAYDGW